MVCLTSATRGARAAWALSPRRAAAARCRQRSCGAWGWCRAGVVACGGQRCPSCPRLPQLLPCAQAAQAQQAARSRGWGASLPAVGHPVGPALPPPPFWLTCRAWRRPPAPSSPAGHPGKCAAPSGRDAPPAAWPPRPDKWTRWPRCAGRPAGAAAARQATSRTPGARRGGHAGRGSGARAPAWPTCPRSGPHSAPARLVGLQTSILVSIRRAAVAPAHKLNHLQQGRRGAVPGIADRAGSGLPLPERCGCAQPYHGAARRGCSVQLLALCFVGFCPVVKNQVLSGRKARGQRREGRGAAAC